MAIENYLGNGIVGDSTGKGIVGSNTGKGIVGGNTGKGIVNDGSGNSTGNAGNIYMHPPYAVIVEPTNEGGNVTQGNKNYQATYNAYKAAAAKLVDQTEEALTAKAAWSTPPSVSIENGKLTLNGSDAFLKSNEAAQLRKTLKAMEGKTYNTEDLNKQIEAWNTALSEMSKGYLDTVDAMNQANYALSQSAENNEYHKLTISDMQKIGNSASIGKQPDAKTTKNKIFVGFEWDDGGNMKEKWVEAKDFYKEFNSLDDDKKRSAYHSLIAQANNGDVGAYSKLTYLNGGSEGKPTNVEYDAVGDFFHTFGENLLTGLAEAADFVTTYIPVFNTARLTGRIVRAAGAGDINEFFKSDDIRNMIDDYEDVVSWENSYFSELTPGSTQAAAISGSVVGNVLGMAYSIWAGGVGNAAGLAVANAATQPIKLAIASANQSLVNSGKFVAFSRSTVTGAQGAMGGAVRTAGSISNRFLIPTAIVEKFPNFSSALADTALKFSEMSGIGNTGATAAQALSGSEKAVTLVTNTVGAGANVVSKTSMVTLAGKPLAQEKAIATGIQTAFRLAPLAGEVALRHTDQYFQKLNAGEEVGELSDYVFENTVKDMAWGAAFMAAGAGFKKLKDVAKAAKKSPADAASAASYASENTQQGFYNDSHFTYDRGSNYLPSGLERTQDFQEFVSTIMTVNGEGIYAVPNSSAPMTVSAVPGTNVAQEAGKVFGAVSKNVIKQYEVEPVPDGANVVETVTNLDGTKTISKQHFDSLDEANDAVRGKTVPTTSPKTLANNDQVADIKVAPLTINGVAPEVLPKGVTQIKFEPGVVYRTPDDLVDELVSIAAKEGWHTDNQDRLYREYEQYQKEVEAQQEAIETIGEAPALPKEMWGTDIEGVLRTAAWAKVRGYNAIPLRVPTSYSRTIKKFSMLTERVRADETEITPNNIVGMQYGVPYEYFANESDALAWAKEEGNRAVHRLDDNADILTRPPVTTEDLVENPLLLGAGEGYIPHVERFDELMTALPTLMEEGEGAIDYLRGIVDIAREVNAVYTAVAANVNLDDIYSRYAKAIYDGEEVSLTPDEKKALEPITHVLDVLGHYFDPSGKSLTQEFYLPTALATNKMVNIEKALLKGEEVDLEHPVDTGFNDILLDLQRIGDAGFWQKRTGDLFRDEDGNFTMARAGTLQNALTSYTVSALTRGKNGLAVAINNEVAKSKYDRNRSQITEKQAYAGIKEADKIRGKTKSYRAAISKDADKIAELKEDYDESAVDQAMKAKNYSKDLGFVKGTNHAAQLLGYNQFLEMTPIQGSVIRYGTQGQVYRGTTNIRRKMEKINITGPMWVTRFGAKQRIGFGLEASEANTKKYGVFKAGEPAVNLGRIVSMNFDSDINALAYLYTLKGVIKAWSTGDGMDMVTAVNKYARENFPLLDDYEWNAAKLLKELARNYHASADPMAVDAMNVDSISKWIRDCTATCFNNAIMMTDISNLDERTLEALDEAAAYIYVGSPLKRNKIINTVLQWESVAKLGGNVSPMLGNIVSEIFTRLPGYIGWKDTTRALKRALDTKEAARINNIISDLPSHYDSPEDDTMLQTAKKLFGTVTDKATGAALKPLTWSEKVKNVAYYAAGEINAERKGITDPAKKQLEAIRFVGEHAIAGGKGTTPGVAESSLGRTLFLFRTFTIRNFDDFIDFVEKASRGETGDNYWDAKYEKKYGKDNKDRSGRNKASFKLGAKAVGGRLMRSYVIWLTILSYFGKGFMDALGGDPTGITDGGKDRGLYDDEDTDEYEGMTDFDNFINGLPAGVIFGSLQDLYFAARRRGVDSKQFMAFDLWNDQKLNNDMSKHLPLGVAYNRFADMLDLLDRGYSFSSTGKKTYAAPETALDVVKGFLFGKSTTENSLAYGKYRYGTVNIWGDLSSGDWMDFAMNANPLKDITGSNAQFDTTRKNYTGVFDGSWNDIATMQLIIAQFKERQQTIIDDYNRDKYRYGGDYEGLTDAEKVAKAKETREKKIEAYTEDVQRAVNAFTDAGNALSDKQITNLMYLFDFHEGEEDDEWNSSVARERYVEAGLPDYNAAAIQRTTKTEDGEKTDVTKNYLDRSLILQNAQQGFYGSSKKAANAVKEALSGFDSTYKAYKERVKALNDKYFTAREKNKKSAETKQLSKDLEKLQSEYLDKLYQQLTPVVEQYGTALIGTYDVTDVLEDYMSNMIPYSSIKKYGQTYSSGNDIVYGQLAEWLQKRWGRNAPTAPSDKEVTNGISEIKKLLDQGKTAAAKSKARAILEKIGRGSLGARRYDVETLRDVAYD